MRNHLSAVALATLSSFAPAQNFVVTPAVCTSHEGTSQNTFPFNSSFHYMQLHGELKGTPRALAGIAWRRDCSVVTAGQVARTLDVELFLGDCNYATASATYASNYTSTPVNVYLRKLLNCPDHSVHPDFQPAPWDVNALFDAPWIYLGTADLAWEAVVYSASSTTSYYCDAYTATTLAAGFASSGTGCTTSNGTMKLRSGIVSNTGTNAWTFGWSVTGGPTSATTTVMLGFSNPSFPVPGLCAGANYYTDGAYATLFGTTNATGTAASIPAAQISVPFDQALVGFPVAAQAASVDPSQPGLGVAASNGNLVKLPPLMPVPAIQLARIYASGAPAAVSGTLSTTSGLVTRFQYRANPMLAP